MRAERDIKFVLGRFIELFKSIDEHYSIMVLTDFKSVLRCYDFVPVPG